MLEEHLDRIFGVFETHGVRFLVVGGLAVVAHGHVRFTNDLDLVIAMDSGNVKSAIKALQELGYVPRAPVAPELLADPRARQEWESEKHMTVFQMFSDRQSETTVDIFLREPFDFEAEFRRAPRLELVEGRAIPVVSFETLLAMKRLAARPLDLDDIRQLQQISGSERLGG